MFAFLSTLVPPIYLCGEHSSHSDHSISVVPAVRLFRTFGFLVVPVILTFLLLRLLQLLLSFQVNPIYVIHLNGAAQFAARCLFSKGHCQLIGCNQQKRK
jgi:hypothetical protein